MRKKNLSFVELIELNNYLSPIKRIYIYNNNFNGWSAEMS